MTNGIGLLFPFSSFVVIAKQYHMFMSLLPNFSFEFRNCKIGIDLTQWTVAGESLCFFRYLNQMCAYLLRMYE